ncbi:N-6 DNA methylase [Erythrobacter sp. SN021]|uniref:N-6 DNA methylase n=1 Tax=Erythrobacter sp. SN021 TaxID=2912574 RepID=UPI001F031E15|nr:N-6 DNA methylase [Erythrobacter sp. SN021]MCF8883414.1 N-6 DNA methylase [Erythrobacter sp. SN021]
MTIPDPEALSSAYEPEFSAKRSGAFFTPESVSQSLVHWACRSPSERMLDPSCGDGEFLRHHWNSVGIEQNPVSAHQAMDRAPGALVHEGDFFAWAADTSERFECAAGNPPFIRYQTFKGPVRQRALALCSDLGAHFSGLSSSWAPFLVATASLLKPGGRMAFVVPAEIGHAPYAAPLLHYLTQNFERVQVIAVREKLFPHLSEDCWLLFAEGFSGQTDSIRFTVCDRFEPSQEPPSADTSVLVSEWEQTWQNRLRSLILPDTIREIYRMAADDSGSHRLGDFARIGIGYVSGDNRFFHLTPAEAKRWGIPDRLLLPSVRKSRSLPTGSITRSDVEAWKADDAPCLLLRLPREGRVPVSVANYLESASGMAARKGYKCRTRSPWYAVPDVRIPDYVMTYMSGRSVKLVRNDAGVTCTNSLHAVNLTNKTMAKACLARWSSPFTQLSCEIEGHALGGGMLKLEPREARRVLFPPRVLLAQLKIEDIEASTRLLQSWRHYADRP